MATKVSKPALGGGTVRNWMYAKPMLGPSGLAPRPTPLSPPPQYVRGPRPPRPPRIGGERSDAGVTLPTLPAWSPRRLGGPREDAGPVGTIGQEYGGTPRGVNEQGLSFAGWMELNAAGLGGRGMAPEEVAEDWWGDWGSGWGNEAPPTPVNDLAWRKVSFDAPDGRAPSWWTGFVAENTTDASRADVQALMLINTMIPYMSQEDQERAASYLYTAAPKVFSEYEKVAGLRSPAPVERQRAGLSSQNLPVIDAQYFMSKARGVGANQALGNMMQAAGIDQAKVGTGMAWVQQILTLMENYGGVPAGQMTKTKQMEFLSALDPLMAQANTEQVGSLGVLGQMLAMPFFSQGQLFKSTRQPTGEFVFGTPNPLFMR